jgi:hypothetical protein
VGWGISPAIAIVCRWSVPSRITACNDPTIEGGPEFNGVQGYSSWPVRRTNDFTFAFRLVSRVHTAAHTEAGALYVNDVLYLVGTARPQQSQYAVTPGCNQWVSLVARAVAIKRAV